MLRQFGSQELNQKYFFVPFQVFQNRQQRRNFRFRRVVHVCIFYKITVFCGGVLYSEIPRFGESRMNDLVFKESQLFSQSPVDVFAPGQGRGVSVVVFKEL